MFLFLFFSFHLVIGGPISLDGIIPLFFSITLSYFPLVIYSYFLAFHLVEVTLDIINFI